MKCESMMMNLSESEMLALWKTRLQLTPIRRNCSIERDDGIDLDHYLLSHIGQWYATLLETATADHLPVEDVSSMVSCQVNGDGIVTVSLPHHCVRPLEWHVKGWQRSVTQFFPPDSLTALSQSNPYLRGNESNPIAILCGTELRLYTTPATTCTIDKAMCIVRPTDGSYRLSEAALSTIDDYLSQHNDLM